MGKKTPFYMRGGTLAIWRKNLHFRTRPDLPGLAGPIWLAGLIRTGPGPIPATNLRARTAWPDRGPDWSSPAGPSGPWPDQSGWQRTAHQKHRHFHIGTPNFMILGLLESQRRVLQDHVGKHHSTTTEYKIKRGNF
jgi:hypothetical protein